jgi:DNA-binding transcriptional ArsR family regulator
MSDAARLAQVAAMVGDPARANVLAALLDGRALPAGELAYAARVTPQTVSEHLAKMVDAGLLAAPFRQGRHRYYRLASREVAAMLESIMVVAGPAPAGPRQSSWRNGEAMRNARTCYDHFAGRLGVGIADALRARGYLVLSDDGAEITETGVVFLKDFGAAVPTACGRAYCRPCLDWSERRFHIAGRVGAAITRRCFELRWVARQPTGRAITVTPAGRTGFIAAFGLDTATMSATRTDAAVQAA